MFGLGLLALTTTSTVSSSDFSSIFTAIASQISVSTVVEVLVYIVGITIGLVFLWWGVRKATRAIMSAFRKGKLSV